MDKLKPVLAQKFWIFFGLVLIMPIVGYFMTKGDLAAQITERWTKLDGTFKGIPEGTDAPNKAWIDGIAGQNSQQELHNGLANDALWKAQAAKNKWPMEIAAAMQQCEYFKSLAPERGGGQVPFKYRLNYARQIRRLWEIVDPLDDAKNPRNSDARRKVLFAISDLQQVNPAKWEQFEPTFDEIWTCQEDIWLQTELLSAIARVNANYQSVADAVIKQLVKITLFGGTKATGDAGTAAPAGGSPMGGDGGFNPMMSGGRKTETAASADIPLAEEFNASIDQAAGPAASGIGAGFGGEGAGSSSGMGGGGGAPAKSDVKRYLDDDEKQPFKRRGFYIKLVMDHRKVPELLAELMNSPFPVEIIRVHQTWYSDTGTGGAASGGGALAGYSGASSPPAGPFGGSESFASPTTSGETSSATTGTSGARPGISSANAQSAMSDPNLASVAILGVWTLYRPPVIDPNKPAPAPASATGAAAGLATTAPAEAASPAEPVAKDPSDPKEAVTATENADSKEPAEPKTDSTEKETPDKPSTEPSDKPAAEPKAE